MSTRSNILCLAAAGLILAAMPIWAKPTHHTSKPALKKAAEDTVTIENSGSTNTTGYQITVSSGGSASYLETNTRSTSPENLLTPRIQALSKTITTKLFTDLAAAGPLASLPIRHTMQSVSFGTSTFVTYHGQRSPDLTAPASPQAMALREDVIAVAQSLHAANNPRFPLSRPILP